MMSKTDRSVPWRSLASAWLLCALAACGGGGSGDSGGGTTPPVTYSLGGTVSGLSATGLILANAGTTLAVASGATTFSFGSVLNAGSSYAVTVQSSPTGQTCTVTSGTGSSVAANVTNVAVACVANAANTFSLGGTISGLTAAGMVLRNNGTDPLTVTANATTFTMPTAVALGATYAVTVGTQPTGQTCTVSNGTGTASANITNVAVICVATAANTFTVGGTISGLTTAGLVLRNGTDSLTLAANATTFTMPTAVVTGVAYAVTVGTQPTGRTCTVTSGAGTVATANITNVAVACTANPNTVGGTVSGLNTAGLVLANGSDTVTVASGATAFTLPTPVAAGATYTVTVKTRPAEVACTLTNATGTMPSTPVTNVQLTCSASNWAWIGGTQSVDSSGTYPSVPGPAAAGLSPSGRYQAVSWRDSAGALWEFGGQAVDSQGTHGQMNDLWKFTPSTGLWAWVGGAKVTGAPATGVYGTQNVPAAGNIPGGRWSASAWTDANGDFWLFGGALSEPTVGVYLLANDLWRYRPSTGLWTWVSGAGGATGQFGVYGQKNVAANGNVPGSRKSSSSWIDPSGNLWLFGGVGVDAFNNTGHLNDLWKFSPITGQWTWVSGSNTANPNAVYGTLGTAAAANVPSGRQQGSMWADSGGNLWLFGGYGPDPGSTYGDFNDLWRFTPSTGQWTWMGGQPVRDTAGIYGVQGVAAAANVPGARNAAANWVDAAGNFWLLGGYARDAQNTWNNMNDLWRYQPATGQWTWMKGSNLVSAPGAYGTQGTAAPNNTPGARNSTVTWTDATGSLWVHGGIGLNGGGNNGLLTDLWKY